MAAPRGEQTASPRNGLRTAAAALRERLRRFDMTGGPRGGCEREPLADDPGRWTWCAACLTVFDDYGIPVNPIPEFARAH